MISINVAQVRRITLQFDQHDKSSLYRFQKGWMVQFIVNPLLKPYSNITIHCNHPPDVATNYIRDKFYPLIWKNNEGVDNSDRYAELVIQHSGSFKYYVSYDGCENSCSGFMVVEPEMVLPNNDVLPLDCLCCQTYLTKQLGTLEEWESRLEVAYISGYNMIHFTPVQTIGASESGYSLKDHLELDPRLGSNVSWDKLHKLLRKMKKQWQMFSICDVVLNHVSYDSVWIGEHPESAYNLDNSRHLRPSYVLDRIICAFSNEVANGDWKSKGIPADITTENHLDALRAALQHDVIPDHKLEQFYQVNIENTVKLFVEKVEANKSKPSKKHKSHKKLYIIQDPNFMRFGSTVDMDIAFETYNIHTPVKTMELPKPQEESRIVEKERIARCAANFREALIDLNEAACAMTWHHLLQAVDSVVKGVRYGRIADDGPHLGPITLKNPLVTPYFYYKATDPSSPTDLVHLGMSSSHRPGLDDVERMIYDTLSGKYVMAHNGWVMSADALTNFAEPPGFVYLRRELIVWGDSIKLRYGPQDECKFLWDYMKTYVEQVATVFDGIRLDNCHNTPMPVLKTMVDQARAVNPNLYVIAELFTGSSDVDHIFVNELGITSLVREALAAGTQKEEGHLVHRYGGDPVGSFVQPALRSSTPGVAHAMFFDLTHDNPAICEKRSVQDTLPTAAIVAFSCTATGSTRGYDELLPHNVHVVSENRLYTSWTDSKDPKASHCNLNTGIIRVKKLLNDLHVNLCLKNYNEVYVDNVDADIVAVTRHCPITHQSVIVVTRTAFSKSRVQTAKHYMPPLCIPGHIDEIIFEAILDVREPSTAFQRDKRYINGIDNFVLRLKEGINVQESEMLDLQYSDLTSPIQEIEFANFPPGSVVVLKVSLSAKAKASTQQIRMMLYQLGIKANPAGVRGAGHLASFNEIIASLSLADLNKVMYSCADEERAEHNIGAYDIPGYGQLPFCGLFGFVHVLSKIRPVNDLGHPLCENLRKGDWMMEYTTKRLSLYPGLVALCGWFTRIFELVSELPRYLIPTYFDAIITGTFLNLLDMVYDGMSPFIRDSSRFTQLLALSAIQLSSIVKDAPLPYLSPTLSGLAYLDCNTVGNAPAQLCVSLAAGLPHFSHGAFRNWGRDTFISLRGLYLVTGKYMEARNLILAYAGCLRHGLIPNLLCEGGNARYNCRDAVWWWLYCITQYCAIVPDGAGFAILNESVAVMYPEDTSVPVKGNVADTKRLSEVMQHALQCHSTGISFRERGAGPGIDNHMRDLGFDVTAAIDWKTGFPFGGNSLNCGTWMDKMGESEKAGTRGIPATPRDGSAVELVALCYSVVCWASVQHEKGVYPYKGVNNEAGSSVLFKHWAQLIKGSFDRQFWVGSKADDEQPSLVSRTGIYKDTVGASNKRCDYQLRPNFAVAIAVSPELFTLQNAWLALGVAESVLMGPLGMKTLDPMDYLYCGYYDQSNDGHDGLVAKGFNYHQGPEWLWVQGFFLRAKLAVAKSIDTSTPGSDLFPATTEFVKSRLTWYQQQLERSAWQGLPELTNENGTHCRYSCNVQAWSAAALLDVLYDLHTFG